MTSADSRTPQTDALWEVKLNADGSDFSWHIPLGKKALHLSRKLETELSAAIQRAEQAERTNGEVTLEFSRQIDKQREQYETRLTHALADSEQHKAQLAESRLAQALKQAEAACDAVMKRLEGRGGWTGAHECKQAIRALSPAGGEDGGK